MRHFRGYLYVFYNRPRPCNTATLPPPQNLWYSYKSWHATIVWALISLTIKRRAIPPCLEFLFEADKVIIFSTARVHGVVNFRAQSRLVFGLGILESEIRFDLLGHSAAQVRRAPLRETNARVVLHGPLYERSKVLVAPLR